MSRPSKEARIGRGRLTSMVAGGLLEMSSTTRLTPWTSFVIRFDTFDKNSGGNGYLYRCGIITMKVFPFKGEREIRSVFKCIFLEESNQTPSNSPSRNSPSSGHEIRGSSSSESNNLIISSLVSLNSNSSNR